MLKFRPYAHRLPLRSKWLLLLGVALNLALLLWGLTVFPQFLGAAPEGPTSLVGSLTILFTYAVAGWVALPRLREPVLRAGLWGGLATAVIFAAETGLEYLSPPSDTTDLALWEFGLAFLVLLGTGFWVGRSGRPVHGIFAALVAATFGSLVWMAVTLGTFYLFFGTPVQQQIFRAEGALDAFSRWGDADFTAFIMGEYLSASFFHLMLVPLVAVFLGAVGGWVGDVWQQVVKKK